MTPKGKKRPPSAAKTTSRPKQKVARKKVASRAHARVAAPLPRSTSGKVVRFRDWGLRLVVLEALHDLGHFHAEFDEAEELAMDAEYDTISKPARRILDAIPMTPELLASVSRLSLDVGNVHQVLTSDWSGEDDIFEIRDVADVARLPNLTEVSVVSNVARGTDLSPIAALPKLRRFRCTIGAHWVTGLSALAALAARGVEVRLSE